MTYSPSAQLAAIVAFLATRVVAPGTASYNGLALTPQMGWDNWNAFGCDIDEKLLLGTAQLIVDYGLRDLGTYQPNTRSSSIAPFKVLVR